MNDTAEGIKTEKFSKKKGRPKQYPDECIDLVFKTTDIKTHRGARNELSSDSAYVNLLDTGDPKYNYLLKPKMKRTILAQLGRIHDKKLMFKVAERICEERAKTGDAVAYIRDLFKAGKPVDEQAFYMHLIRVIQNYLNKHGDLDKMTIEITLERILKVIKGMDEF